MKTYRNLNFVDHSQPYVVTMTTCSQVSVWLWMTLMTTTKRGAVEIRERMRTQDPHFAPSAKLAAKDDGRLAFSPPRMLSGQAPLFPEERKGRWRPPEEHREPRPPAASRGGSRGSPSAPRTRRVGRGTASGRSQEDAQFTPAFATCTIPGVYTTGDHQTGMLDYTGQKYDPLPAGLAVNLNNIKVVMKNLLANTRKILGSGRSVALCVRAQPATTTTLYPRGQLCSGERSSSTSVRLQPAQDPEGRARSFRHRYGREEEPRGREGAPGRLRQLRHHHSEGGRVSEVRSLG